MPMAVFRADASASIGGGHVMRCLALARELERAGWTVLLACRAGTVETIPEAATIASVTLPDCAVAEEPARLAQALPQGCDWLVIDSYAWSNREEAACRGFARRIAVLDDFACAMRDADLLLDPTPGRERAAYVGLLPTDATVLAGAAWAPLRWSLRAARMRALHEPHGGTLARIVIAMGLTDPQNATTFALASVVAAGLPARVDVILGGSAPHRDTVRAALPVGATLHLDPSDLPGLIAQADLAIGSGGVSALERACLGVPSLLMELAENQRAAIAGLVDAGAARALGPRAACDAHMIARALGEFEADPSALQAMARAAARVCDGLGAARTAIHLAPERASDGGTVTLRPAHQADCERLFTWQSIPGIRAYSRNPTPPTRSEHDAWFDSVLADPMRILSIVEHKGAPACMLRLDAAGDACDAYEVSILVHPDKQRLGIARSTLRLARRLVPGATLHAEILAPNMPSYALFRSADYEETATPGMLIQRPPQPASVP